MGTYIIKNAKSDAGGFVFDLLANNKEVIANSQVYTSKESCKNGIASVAKNAPQAPIEDQTAKDYAEQKNPKFEVYKDKGEKFRFRLKASNGEIIAVGQGYTTKQNCLNGIESIRKNAGSDIEDTSE